MRSASKDVFEYRVNTGLTLDRNSDTLEIDTILLRVRGLCKGPAIAGPFLMLIWGYCRDTD